MRTYPNIGSWSAVQMKGLKTIQDDQLRFWCNFVQFLTILPPEMIQMTPGVEAKTQKTFGNVCNGPYLVYEVH